MTVVYLTRFQRKPLHLFGSVGLACLGAGLLINLYLSIIWLGGEAIGHRPLLQLGILLFLEAGAQAIWGADFHRMATPYNQILTFGGLTMPAQRVLIIVAAFLLVVLDQLQRLVAYLQELVAQIVQPAHGGAGIAALLRPNTTAVVVEDTQRGRFRYTQYTRPAATSPSTKAMSAFFRLSRRARSSSS